jgi:hypothetical protein
LPFAQSTTTSIRLGQASIFGIVVDFEPGVEAWLQVCCREAANQPYWRLAICRYCRARGGDNRSRNYFLQKHMPALAMIALIGFCCETNAQAQCPEFTRLRSEATEASKHATGGGLVSGRCEAYVRSSRAWSVVVQYVNDHREMCDISIHSLSEFEKTQREAERARDNVCAGRPARPFPPEIIRY